MCFPTGQEAASDKFTTFNGRGVNGRLCPNLPSAARKPNAWLDGPSQWFDRAASSCRKLPLVTFSLKSASSPSAPASCLKKT